ncbi:MAG: hypothetical protein N3A01_03520 [Bacteroidales bacterium]|nr:hypothetical protein [Bacteroidales bacterium]
MLDFYISENTFDSEDQSEEEKNIDNIISTYYISPPADFIKKIVEKIFVHEKNF